jgi:hypothetical protein
MPEESRGLRTAAESNSVEAPRDAAERIVFVAPIEAEPAEKKAPGSSSLAPDLP